jgi:glycosyltransferase involved in cell wall biosynthesis
VTVLHGYLPHADSIALMRSADLLFLPMQNLPNGRRSSTIPGKTFEYLASGRPILGAVPNGDARDIIQEAGHTVCGPDDVDAIADSIARAVERKALDPAPFCPDWSVVRQFERRQLAKNFAEVIDEVAQRR